MKLLEFKKAKYWDKFVDLKKLNQEFNQNEKNIKKFYAMNKSKTASLFELNFLKSEIVWIHKKKLHDK